MSTTHLRSKEWFDDDAFWRALYPYMFPERRFVAAQDEVEKVIALTQPADKAVLDLACGPGRCAIALAQRGYEVVGVDRTKYLLDKARRKARAAGVKVRWLQQDMRDYVREQAFGLVINMFTSFGYFEDKQEDNLVLQNIHASLKPGGCCLLEMISKEWLARHFLATNAHEMPDGTLFVERREIFDDWTRIRDEWTLIRDGRARTFRFHHTVYSGQELRDRLERAGFVDIAIYGDLDGAPYDRQAKRLIATGRRPRR